MAVQVATDADFKELIGGHDKVVVKFFADWCGSCRLFAPKYRRLSDDERFTDVLFLDVNAEENPEARKAANVSNLPTFATFKGGALQQSVATTKEEALVEMITEVQNA